MKNIILSNIFLKEDEDISISEGQLIEIEEEEMGCDGCSEDFMTSSLSLTADFLWHPKKKF